jgi:co-chaperonin GroES (HSP10)
MENKFKGKALNQVVILKEVTYENKTKSGIDLTGISDATEKYKKGLIISIGEFCPKLSDGSFTLKEGDEVIFDKFKMTNFTQDGITYILIDYRDLVLVF